VTVKTTIIMKTNYCHSGILIISNSDSLSVSVCAHLQNTVVVVTVLSVSCRMWYGV